MKRASSVWAFGVVILALGLVVWLSLRGGAAPSQTTAFHLAAVALLPGESYVVFGINKSPLGPPVPFDVIFNNSQGAQLSQQTFIALPGGFGKASFECPRETGSEGCELWATAVAQFTPVGDAGFAQLPVVSATFLVLDRRG